MAKLVAETGTKYDLGNKYSPERAFRELPDELFFLIAGFLLSGVPDARLDDESFMPKKGARKSASALRRLMYNTGSPLSPREYQKMIRSFQRSLTALEMLMAAARPGRQPPCTPAAIRSSVNVRFFQMHKRQIMKQAEDRGVVRGESECMQVLLELERAAVGIGDFNEARVDTLDNLDKRLSGGGVVSWMGNLRLFTGIKYSDDEMLNRLANGHRFGKPGTHPGAINADHLTLGSGDGRAMVNKTIENYVAYRLAMKQLNANRSPVVATAGPPAATATTAAADPMAEELAAAVEEELGDEAWDCESDSNSDSDNDSAEESSDGEGKDTEEKQAASSLLSAEAAAATAAGAGSAAAAAAAQVAAQAERAAAATSGTRCYDSPALGPVRYGTPTRAQVRALTDNKASDAAGVREEVARIIDDNFDEILRWVQSRSQAVLEALELRLPACCKLDDDEKKSVGACIEQRQVERGEKRRRPRLAEVRQFALALRIQKIAQVRITSDQQVAAVIVADSLADSVPRVLGAYGITHVKKCAASVVRFYDVFAMDALLKSYGASTGAARRIKKGTHIEGTFRFLVCVLHSGACGLAVQYIPMAAIWFRRRCAAMVSEESAAPQTG